MTLQDKWEEFAAAFVDPMVDARERALLRSAFHAGAASLMTMQADAFKDMTMEDAFAFMDRLNNECLRFVRDMKGGRAN